jgi:hypothetical protein
MASALTDWFMAQRFSRYKRSAVMSAIPAMDPRAFSTLGECADRPPDLARRPTDLLLRHCRHCAVAFATSAILLILILRFVYGIAFRTFLNVFMIRIQASSHKLLFLPEYAC